MARRNSDCDSSDPQLLQITNHVPLDTLKQISIQYLGFTKPEIDIICENKPKEWETKFAILENWRNRNSGPEGMQILADWFHQAHQEGLLCDTEYSSLCKILPKPKPPKVQRPPSQGK